MQNYFNFFYERGDKNEKGTPKSIVAIKYHTNEYIEKNECWECAIHASSDFDKSEKLPWSQ